MSIVKVVIYGFNRQARQMKSFFEHDNCAQVCAYVADRNYIKEDILDGVPIYAFEDIVQLFPPNEYQIAISFGYGNMTRDRQNKYEACKELGYTVFTYISKDAHVYTTQIAEGCMIYPGCIVAPGVMLGVGCHLEVSVTIAHDTRVGKFCYFSPGAVICGLIEIGDNCFLGPSCNVTNKATVADFTLVASNAVITKDTQPEKVYFPARTEMWRGTSSQINIP